MGDLTSLFILKFRERQSTSFGSLFVVHARYVLLFADPDVPFKLEIKAYLQQSHTDLHAQRHEYDKEIHNCSLIHWSQNTMRPVIFQNHKEEHDDINGKK